MKDLDFDELDKAVNSLMQDGLKPQQEGAAAAPDMSITQPVPESASEPVLDPLPVAEEVVAPMASTATVTTQSGVSFTPKRSGRFMDVMHPSSDMRPPLSMPTRVGKEITPMSTDSNIVASAPAVEEPAPEIPVPESVEPAKEAEDMLPTDDIANEMTSAPKIDHLDTPASPFLSDAKVEKRPLGGAAPALDTEAVVADTAEDVDSTFASPSDSPEVPLPLPVELSGDVLSIESDATSHANNASPSGTVIGSSSIAQQYKEKENSGDQSHAPIYDTNLQPLAHPARKKSGWGVVLWIVLIILFCVGVAAALYFVGIIQLPV